MFIYRAHWKRLITLILRPSTMQCVAINGIFPDVPLLDLLRATTHTWISLMLGACYSSNTTGDEPRSAEAQCRRSRTRRKKFVSKVDKRRLDQKMARTGLEADQYPIVDLPVEPMRLYRNLYGSLEISTAPCHTCLCSLLS